MTNKEIERLKELDIKASKCEHFTSEELQERNELEFKRNKQTLLKLRRIRCFTRSFLVFLR